MCLTQEYFDERDKSHKQFKQLGFLTLEQACEELKVDTQSLYDVGVLESAELTTARCNLTTLSAIGRLFFVEEYQEIFISSENIERLRRALTTWGRFEL
ncbi:hypothetical protein BCV02_13000 [Vibrio breoganii]|uniref:Uncharacterized protein n=1 Tax=Vibrio breoganii TaxID=553239 RepID=A0AAP8SVH8_9VIBR|nr:hypothetical protein [Vibrio breoganii]NMO74699.1 hypothetical protein [Vibrio breoganii]NMR71192.1 hypothetical protein [Vibrio breoganii]PMG01909.1 hypothetical protein BCV02_13000 [Vibrio breoganii]PML88403.1 hypothetical protein BCT67_09810 [Vibrio breoganii]PMP07441.1 hypothetical protein BCS93_15915 [Vibrio breoganii]